MPAGGGGGGMGRREKGRRRLFLFPLSFPSSPSPKCSNSLPRPFHDRRETTGEESASDMKQYHLDDRNGRNRLDRREVYPDHYDHDHDHVDWIGEIKIYPGVFLSVRL